MRKIFLITGVVVLLTVFGFSFHRLATKEPDNSTWAPPPKPNVVIVVSDALRQDVLGCYGGEAITPNIDHLASQGVLFENAYCASPWTAPSSVSMFTGNYATSYACSPQMKTKKASTTTIYVPHSDVLLAERILAEGYHTGRIVENVNASIHNNLQGFNPAQDSKPTPQLVERLFQITGNRPDNSIASMHASAFLGHLLNRPPGEPFVALHWILDPHYPYEPPAKFESRIDFDRSLLPKPKKFYEKGIRYPKRISEIEREYYKKLYVAEVESVDERIGNLLKVLEHKNLLATTYIIFTSDHGEQFGQHGLYGHGGLGRGCHYYDGLMRIPLIIAGPDLPAGRRVAAYVSNLDLMPTLKEMLGIEYEDNMQGISFASLLHEDDYQDRPIYLNDVVKNDQADALVDNHIKLIALANGGFELYDVSSDPEELNNLANKLTDRVNTMFDWIKNIRKENEDLRAFNIAVTDDHLKKLSEEERKKIEKKLKSLGYVH